MRMFTLQVMKDLYPISAIICAAGMSSRMGFNKLTLPWGHKSVLGIMAERCLDARFAEVIIVGGHEIQEHFETLSGEKLIFTYNAAYRHDLALSIRQGVLASAPSTIGFAIILADLLALPTVTLTNLNSRFMELFSLFPEAIVRPVYESLPGHPVYFSSHYRSKLVHLDVNFNQQSILKEHQNHVHFVSVQDGGVVWDADTPADLDKFQGFA